MKPYLGSLVAAADIIRDQDVSSYPILVIHQNTVDIGINIVNREAVNGNWSVNASMLEEFVAKQIIATDKLDDFKSLYRQHEDEVCLFVLSETRADFVFLPKNL